MVDDDERRAEKFVIEKAKRGLKKKTRARKEKEEIKSNRRGRKKRKEKSTKK